jgi:hypothetical protein
VSWLIRTFDFHILGPHSTEEIKEMILSGKFSPKDEICQGNDHWISMTDHEILLSRFGVAPPRVDITPNEDDTETGTVTILQEKDRTPLIAPVLQARNPEKQITGVISKPTIFISIESPSILKWVTIILLFLAAGITIALLNESFRNWLLSFISPALLAWIEQK